MIWYAIQTLHIYIYTCGGDGNGRAGKSVHSVILSVSFRIVCPQLLLLLLLQRSELLLSFTALGCGNPSALDVGLALKPSALTASPASEVRTVFLRLVPAVLTVQAARWPSRPHHRQSKSRRLIRHTERHVFFVGVGVVVVVVVPATRTHPKRVVVAQALVLVIGLRPYLEALVVDLLVPEQE